MRRYPAYRDSGVEWLGEVPDGWGVSRIKENTYLKGRVGWKGLHSDEFQELSFAYLVTGTDFQRKYVDWSACYQIDKFRYEDDPFIQLQNGDLLITKDGTIGKLAVIANLDKPACLNSGIFLIRPLHSYQAEFLYWVLSSSSFSVFCDLTTYGSTINHLYQNVFENFAFPIPPLPEQTAIAAFLDRETAKIDALVAEQRRLIDLLREKRQAVISHAVTKGLNPNAPLKPSGIDWLGDVPEGWEIQPIKSVAKLAGRIGYRGYTTADIVEEGEGAITLSPSNIRGGAVSFEQSTYISWSKYHESPEIQLAARDVVMVKTGSTFGKVGYVSDQAIPPSTINPQLVIFKEISCLPEYLFLSLNADHIRGLIEVSNTGGTIPTMTQEAIGNFRVALPSHQEQQMIVDSVKRVTGKLDTLIATAETAIVLLQERRAALISAAVTGKIDVRHLAPSETEAA